MSNLIQSLHADIQYFRSIGCWDVAERLERILAEAL